MKLSSVFERLVLSHARDLAPACKTGRPRALDDQTTLDRIFKLLRTGCQWRELDCAGASHMAVRRRMRLWEDKGVFEKAYQRALETYNVECGAHLHRDYNAAVNIHDKAVRILKDVDHEEDDEFAEYNAECG